MIHRVLRSFFAPDNRLAALVLCAALGFFGWAVGIGWSAGSLPGNEFRQTQTALSAFFIRHENNFSLAYPTPLLGQPWSVPMEFPLYQWTVVGLANLSGLPLVQAARAVSVAYLLLALPALHGLLRRLRLPPAYRHYTLAFVLLCPLHLFYARAFLIETMALMFSLWFAHGFVEWMRRRTLPWLAIATAAGIGAGLAKVTTFLVYLLPAAAWGAYLLGRAWRRRHGPRQPVSAVLARGLAPALPAIGIAWAWVAFADRIKQANPSAEFLLSGQLAGFNFGHGLFGERFAAATWFAMAETWNRGLLPWPAILALLLALPVCAARWRRPALLAAGLFLFVQLACPILYSLHEYYYVACAVLAAVAAGCVFAGLHASRLPRWFAPALALACLGSQIHAYGRNYLPAQRESGPGGTGLTESLQAYTPPESALIVAGADWSAYIPYYAKRRALMIRKGLASDSDYLELALASLQSVEVSALVLVGDQRTNHTLATRTATAFNLDPAPTYRHTTADVYLAKAYREETLRALRQPVHDQISAAAEPTPVEPTAEEGEQVTATQARTTFSAVSPSPLRARSRVGFRVLEYGGERVLNAHPKSDLWIPPPTDATRITCEFGILPGAYEDTEGRTNGVEFVVEAEQAAGTTRTLFRRVLTPAKTPGDRGVQQATFAYAPQPGDTVVFRTRPNGNAAFDWAFWRRIEIK